MGRGREADRSSLWEGGERLIEAVCGAAGEGPLEDV